MAAAEAENTDIEFRAVMKFLTLKGQQPKEIFDSMRDVYGDSSPAYSTVKKMGSPIQARQSVPH